ncbi:MAG: AMP-binding protein [Salinarimonas sp.]
MNQAQWLHRTASARGDAPALMLGETIVADYAAFARRTAGLAGFLAGRGIAPGDRIAILMRNTPDYLVALYGIWWAGAAAVPINAKLHPREIAWIVENAGARQAVATPDLADALPAGVETLVAGTDAFAAAVAGEGPDAPAPREPGDLAWLFYTSGTTGRPKGVVITHGMLSAMSLAYLVDVDRAEPEDTALYAAPLSHGAGLYVMVHVLVAARHSCPPSSGFDPAEILDLAARVGRVHMFMAPTMVRRLTDHARRADRRGEGLRTIVYGGGPMYVADVVDAVERFGPVFVQIYGQGECPMCISALSRAEVADRAHPRWRERLGSAGRAQCVSEIRIADPDGDPLPPGETGEILARGVAVMPGYWNAPEATARALRDGWLFTGDVGSLDADGYLTLKDRSKDLIISGGTNIYPREVEEALLEHESVAACAVVGRPHPDWGEEVVAFVVAANGAEVDAPTLDAHCLERIARFKRPKHYRFVAALPKNEYGKVLKTELRGMVETST